MTAKNRLVDRLAAAAANPADWDLAGLAVDALTRINTLEAAMRSAAQTTEFVGQVVSEFASPTSIIAADILAKLQAQSRMLTIYERLD